MFSWKDRAVAELRLARPSDADAIEELMKASARELFPRYYDERQTASGVEHIAELDTQLIEDGTYFVHEAEGEIVACGGWSRRYKPWAGKVSSEEDARLLDPRTEPARIRAMFVRGDWTRRGLGRAILAASANAARAEGFRELILGATGPGEPLYRACGFEEKERIAVKLPDGVKVDCVVMSATL
jgi:GNAT superfamily N-acetyltransferase